MVTVNGIVHFGLREFRNLASGLHRLIKQRNGQHEKMLDKKDRRLSTINTTMFNLYNPLISDITLGIFHFVCILKIS